MNTTSIEKAFQILFNQCPCVPFYVSAADVNIEPTSFPCIYVKNVSPQSESGQHWVLFFCIDKFQCEYFDPLASPIVRYPHLRPPVPLIVISNPHQLMSNYTLTCGLFVVVFGFLRAKGWSFWEIVNKFFSESVRHNEYIVKRFFSEYLSEFEPAFMYASGPINVQKNVCLAKCFEHM